MSLVVAVCAVLAGAAGWLLPAVAPPLAVRARRAGPLAAGAEAIGSARQRGRPRWPRRAPAELADVGLDAHVEAIHQLAALLHSGRPPAEAWSMLEHTWITRTPATPRDGSVRRYPWLVPGRGSATGTPSADAARDIVAACRAARVSHNLGAGPSAGLARHREGSPAYGHAWERLLWCIRLSESTGAALVDLLNRLADQFEAEQDRRRAIESTLAGPRMTQRLLAWLPALGLVLAQLMGADPAGILTRTTTGRICLAAGAGLWLANRVWCRRLLSAAEPQGLATAHRRPRARS